MKMSEKIEMYFTQHPWRNNISILLKVFNNEVKIPHLKIHGIKCQECERVKQQKIDYEISKLSKDLQNEQNTSTYDNSRAFKS